MSQTVQKIIAYKSLRDEMTHSTPTSLWSDSAALAELSYSIEHGGVGATCNPMIVLDVIKKDVGHGGSTEIMKLIVYLKSPCTGTISFHAELYGTDLLNFALPLAQGRSAPAAHYVPQGFTGRNALIRERGSERLLPFVIDG